MTLIEVKLDSSYSNLEPVPIKGFEKLDQDIKRNIFIFYSFFIMFLTFLLSGYEVSVETKTLKTDLFGRKGKDKHRIEVHSCNYVLDNPELLGHYVKRKIHKYRKRKKESELLFLLLNIIENHRKFDDIKDKIQKEICYYSDKWIVFFFVRNRKYNRYYFTLTCSKAVGEINKIADLVINLTRKINNIATAIPFAPNLCKEMNPKFIYPIIDMYESFYPKKKLDLIDDVPFNREVFNLKNFFIINYIFPSFFITKMFYKENGNKKIIELNNKKESVIQLNSKYIFQKSNLGFFELFYLLLHNLI